MAAPTAYRVVFTVDLHPGSLVLAEMPNASLRILRDGVMMCEHRWMLIEIDAAVRTYKKIRRRVMGKPGAQKT